MYEIIVKSEITYYILHSCVNKFFLPYSPIMANEVAVDSFAMYVVLADYLLVFLTESTTGMKHR